MSRDEEIKKIMTLSNLCYIALKSSEITKKSKDEIDLALQIIISNYKYSADILTTPVHRKLNKEQKMLLLNRCLQDLDKTLSYLTREWHITYCSISELEILIPRVYEEYPQSLIEVSNLLYKRFNSNIDDFTNKLKSFSKDQQLIDSMLSFLVMSQIK